MKMFYSALYICIQSIGKIRLWKPRSILKRKYLATQNIEKWYIFEPTIPFYLPKKVIVIYLGLFQQWTWPLVINTINN